MISKYRNFSACEQSFCDHASLLMAMAGIGYILSFQKSFHYCLADMMIVFQLGPYMIQACQCHCNLGTLLLLLVGLCMLPSYY